MFNLKGFMAIGAFADNAVGVVAPLGELSTNSLTYAKEKGYYTQADAKSVSLVSFLSVDDKGTKVTTPTDLASNVLKVGQWMYDQCVKGGITDDTEAFMRALVNEFSASMGDATCGSMVTDGKYWLPEWLSYTAKPTSSSGTAATVKVWFADDAFQRQFADYEIVVIPPLPVAKLDELFNGAYKVSGLLARKKQSEVMFEIQEARGKYPETYLRTEEYDWIDPTDEDTTIEHGWTVLIYGIGGNNIDNIKDAITKYILANSKHGRDDWAKIIPDLFRSTEFILTPLWNNYAVPNQTLEPGIYSPVVKPAEALALAKKTAVGYPEAHVEANYNTFSVMYNSLGIVAVGGPENRDKIYEFRKKFKDYITVSTTHIDFNRISENTQDFVNLLTKMLLIAETMTPYTDVPVGFTRLTRGGVMFVVANYNDVQYLVVAKAYFNNANGSDIKLG